MTLTLDHIQMAIPPGGETTARAFWCDLIGLEEIDKPESLRARGGLWLDLGNAELHLGIEDPFAPAAKAHPGLICPDLSALSRALSDAGHAVTPDNTIPGRARLFTTDPFGNRLEFLSSP